MITAQNLHIYLAARSSETRSHVENQLVLDGFEVSLFTSARALWSKFQDKPTRFVITDQNFDDNFDSLELARQIRLNFLIPYVYMIMSSAGNSLKEIKEGLDVGVDDYLIKPHNPFQLRSRILVGLRWLNYIDSLSLGKQQGNDNSDAAHTELATRVDSAI